MSSWLWARHASSAPHCLNVPLMEKSKPPAGLEPAALRLRVWCSTDWAKEANYTPCGAWTRGPQIKSLMLYPTELRERYVQAPLWSHDQIKSLVAVVNCCMVQKILVPLWSQDQIKSLVAVDYRCMVQWCHFTSDPTTKPRPGFEPGTIQHILISTRMTQRLHFLPFKLPRRYSHPILSSFFDVPPFDHSGTRSLVNVVGLEPTKTNVRCF